MKIEDFFNQQNVIELSFFNFENAITAAYFARENLEIVRVNDNFRKFFPVLGNVSNAYFPDVLTQLGVSAKQVEQFVRDINDKSWVLIPKVPINIDGNEKIYSLLSTRTRNDSFSYLNGVQGQFVDRTEEWSLRREREDLLEQKIRDRELIEEKTVQLENLATRLAKYLSPQIYQSIFSDEGKTIEKHSRKNLTIFLSDIVKFTDLTDSLEPEKLAQIINSYLSEMSAIALESGGTIDKFIGDADLSISGRAYLLANAKPLRLRDMANIEPQKRLRSPRSVRVDMDGRMFIADYGSFRIQVYQKDAIPLSEEDIVEMPRSPTLQVT